jgi:hypothetical protein
MIPKLGFLEELRNRTTVTDNEMFNRSGKLLAIYLLLASSVGLCPTTLPAQSTDRRAGKPPRILAHYMPWYAAKPFSQAWGWHWTMGTFDPEGKYGGPATLASHYRPIIGPYDSGDPNVLEYHTLLMKLAGIDGVVIDWYGTVDYLDYALNHRNCVLFVDQAAKAGLEFAICYEDQTIPKLVAAGRLESGKRLEHARRELRWVRENWCAKISYLKLGGRPVLLSFGHDGLNDPEWEQVVGAGPDAFAYLSEHQRRKGAAGAFDWPIPQIGPKAQDEINKRATHWPVGMAVAYPRFHDIYEEAKVHPSWGKIDDDHGKTFVSTLEKALRSGLPFVQISTWNDWGEGTMIEPSVEFGSRDLEVVQRLRRQFVDSDFAGKAEDLRLPYRLYLLRKSAKGSSTEAKDLDQIAHLLGTRTITSAGRKMEAIERNRSR